MKAFILQYWVGAAFGVVTAALSAGVHFLRRQRGQQAALHQGLKALLRDRLVQGYHFHMERGFCSVFERDGMTALYEAYHALGGNGTVDDLWRKLQGLPTGITGIYEKE